LAFVRLIGLMDTHKLAFVPNNVDRGTTLPLISVDVIEKSFAQDGIENVGVG
jgi:hypothetical protein